MKKRFLLILLALCTLATMLTGCGGEATAQQNNESQIQELTDAYNSLKSDYDQLESDYLALQEEYSKLQAAHDILKITSNNSPAEPANQEEAVPDAEPAPENTGLYAAPPEEDPEDLGPIDLYDDDMLHVTFLGLNDASLGPDMPVVEIELELENKTDEWTEIMLQNVVINGYSLVSIVTGDIQPGTKGIIRFPFTLSDFNAASIDEMQSASFDVSMTSSEDLAVIIHSAPVEIDFN